MTIASAQGLTVDRAFLLVDDRPARETIYPAATRHREALDIYVNRSPLAFDIAEHRPEEEAERPVLDSDVRAYLAERWSRSQPKEAALDYVSDGMWRDAREAERRQDPRPGDGRDEAAEAQSPANDNAVVRIAQEIRHAVNGWRHGAAVDAFAVEHQEVMASWDELRTRAHEEGEAVALSPAFRETLDRSGALLKQAASLPGPPEGVRPDTGRARRHRRTRDRGAPRTARPRRTLPALGQDEGLSRATTGCAARRSRARRGHRRRDLRSRWRPCARRPDGSGPPQRSTTEGLPASEQSEAAYRQLRIDWRRHIGRADRSGISPFDLDGAAELIRRVGEFAGREGLPDEPAGTSRTWSIATTGMSRRAPGSKAGSGTRTGIGGATAAYSGAPRPST